MNRFQEKVAIITGAGSGIGYEIAKQLVEEGASVILNDLDPKVAQQAAENLDKKGSGRCTAKAGDASQVDFCYEMVDKAVSEFGKIDIIVANAGITLFGNFFDFTPEAFRKVMDLNLQGSFFLTQAAARQMREQGNGGSILLMSSNVGYQAHANLTAYAITKAGLKMMSRNLVKELSPYKIRINTLAPGATLTERTALEIDGYDKIWANLIPLGKIGTPNDIAKSALFLLSDDAGHITGQSLLVDGGWETYSPLPL
jgi:glucose 1-dehydrogenase